MKTKILNIVSYCMLAMFVFSVIVQYNDPDSLVWMSIYGGAALLTIAFIGGRLYWLLPAILFVIAIIWAATIEPNVWGRIAFSDLFKAWKMKSILVEEGREMGGLLIVGGWSLVLTLVSFQRKRTLSQESDH